MMNRIYIILLLLLLFILTGCVEDNTNDLYNEKELKTLDKTIDDGNMNNSNETIIDKQETKEDNKDDEIDTNKIIVDENTMVNEVNENEGSISFDELIDGVLHIKPEVLDYPDISYERIELWNKYNEMLDSAGGEIIIDNLNDEELELYWLFEVNSPWGVNERCGWYCAGGIDEIEATSQLSSEGNINYNVSNIHDFDISTTWSEGALGYGIGEKVNYYLYTYPIGPRAIAINNGYGKTEELFYKNGRAKELAFYIDDEVYCIFELEDTWYTQNFWIERPVKSDDKECLKFTFEIISIYEGEQYEDTCISEIKMSGGH